MKNLLSIDVEEWYNFIGDPGAPPFEEWINCESRVEALIDVILDILDGFNVTFFVLGFIAEHHPALIKRISALGHEIACHGFRHDYVFDMKPEDFRHDISKAKRILEDITGKPCIGYRAPAFSIRKSEMWALEIIREEGFLYDASIFPAVRTTGGRIAGFYKYPQTLHLKAGELIEFPVSATRVLGIDTIVCGGGFFRFFPEWYIHKNIEKINREGHPVVIYLHPRDIDPDQPRMKLKPLNRFLYYYGLKNAKEKFIRLVNTFDWTSFGETSSTRGLF